MYRRQRQLRENKLMRLYPFVGPIPNVITFKLYLDLGIWSSETNVHYLVCCLTYHWRTHRSRVGSWDVHVSRISNIEFTIFRSAWISKGSVPKNSLGGSTVRLNTTWREMEGKVPSLNSFISCQSRFFQSLSADDLFLRCLVSGRGCKYIYQWKHLVYWWLHRLLLSQWRYLVF